MGPIELNVVVFQECDLWVAQCLDHDITARAKTLAAVPKSFARCLAANIAINQELGREGLEGIPPAPRRFHPWN